MRRVSAYGLCLAADGRVLLTRTAEGRWTLPGGVVAHAVDPRDSVVAAFAAQAGVSVVVDGARDLVTEIAPPDERLEW